MSAAETAPAATMDEGIDDGKGAEGAATLNAGSDAGSGTTPANAPAECVGPDSEMAGKAAACEGCPNQAICASSKPKPPDPDLDSIAANLQGVKRIILVLSGKGGVGKSTVTANLAWALAQDEDVNVGVMDVDICGPSIPKIMGIEGEDVHSSASGWSPVYVEDNLGVMSAGILLANPTEAIIWRGPKKNDLIKKFLKDVSWGDLDYLIIDTPPGTSDEHISLVQYLKKAGGVDGAVIVSTPQEVALTDVRKEVSFCRNPKLAVPIIGVIENMSSFVCPHCNKESQIFRATGGGVAAMCEDVKAPFLGSLPLDPRVAQACDEGKSFLDEIPSSPAAAAYNHVVQLIADTCRAMPASR